MIDKDQVKQAARGRWPEILPTLAAFSAEILDGRHYPCPFPGCPGGGGKDRFRALDDFPETGGVICNQCHHDQGDGIGALMKATGKQFPDVLKMLADHSSACNENGNGKGQRQQANRGRQEEDAGREPRKNQADRQRGWQLNRRCCCFSAGASPRSPWPESRRVVVYWFDGGYQLRPF